MLPGDVGFAHTTGIIGRAIRLGEAIRGSKNDAKWNHAFILDRPTENGDWYIIQAEAKGVTNDKLLSQVAPGGNYEVHSVGNLEALEFARAQVGSKYGIITILSCVLDILLPDSICLRRSNTWICSGLVTGALMFAGYTFTYEAAAKDIYTITPAELHRYLVGG